MKVLITGANGLLGQKLVQQAVKKNIPFLATSKGENRNSLCPKENYCSLDITNQTEIKNVFSEYMPTHVIHTAAITNVDECEKDPISCKNVNTNAVKLLFEAAKIQHAHFQLLSTDFVFDGEKGNYSEEDSVNPLCNYAKSKVEAEKILLKDVSQNWSIVRTIIVYGIGENLSRSNLICWAKEALETGKQLSIVDDQFRAPTWADDLAWACLEICIKNKVGIFHISGPETLSIYEIVLRVAKYFNFSIANLSVSKSDILNQAAKRPPRTGFNLTKATNELGYKPKTIEATLDLI